MLATLGAMRWKHQTARDIDKLSVRAPSMTDHPVCYERSEISTLPSPVIRYFEFALGSESPLVESARVEWEGAFSLRPRRWSAFSATQYYRVWPPGFLWDARIRMTPLVPVLVRDAYIDHEGSLRAAIGGVIRVANEHGTPELATGELLRYLGEAVWYPTALLPSAGVSWSPIDHLSATATLRDGATTASMDAHFGPAGEISSISAMRPRRLNGSSVLTPWIARLAGYSARGGMQVPTSGCAEWMLPTGPLPYWRGRLVDVQYDFTA